jgi:hypothetical protein
MALPTAPSDDFVAPAQIWAALNADLQERVIRLLAQLAFSLLTVRTESPINKEALDALSSDQSQNPA